MDELDIILLTHNHLENTIRCMDALYKNTHTDFRVTVIDDSIDETPVYFKRLIKKHGNINYVRPNVKIKSANQAINIGLKLTKSNPVAFLTNSTFVEPDWLGVDMMRTQIPFAIKLFKDDPLVGLVGFKVISPETNIIIEAGDHVFPNAHTINIGRNEPSHHRIYVSRVNAIAFCAILMRRTTIPEGGWDETTYIGFRSIDDVDNCLTVREAGWKILYNGFGSVYHKPESSDSQYASNKKMGGEIIENQKRFYEKWQGKVPLPK